MNGNDVHIIVILGATNGGGDGMSLAELCKCWLALVGRKRMEDNAEPDLALAFCYVGAAM